MSKVDVVTLCQELVKRQSYSGNEKAVASFAENFMNESGFDEVHIDCYGNIVGLIHGNEDGPFQLYDAHIDTVPVPDETTWSHDPFGGIIENGRIYGRGTSDMKGAFAAMLAAARDFAIDNGKRFKGTIAVSGVVHEECFEGVAARKISETFKPDFVIIGEASHLNLKTGQRGRAEIVIETFGKPAHSANPEHGINAVYQMSTVINAVKDIEYKEDPVLGKGILVLVDIKSSPYPGASVVPDYCRTTWDRRLLVGETKESVLAQIQDEIEKLKSCNPDLSVKAGFAKAHELCYTGETIGDERFFPAWSYERSRDFVSETLNELKECDFDTRFSHYDFCTNGSHYAGEAGIRTIGFGPSDEFLAHTIDEYIEIDQLEKAKLGYQVIMQTLQRMK